MKITFGTYENICMHYGMPSERILFSEIGMLTYAMHGHVKSFSNVYVYLFYLSRACAVEIFQSS